MSVRLGLQGAPPSRVLAVASHALDRIVRAALDEMRARYDLGVLLHRLRYERDQRGSPMLTALAARMRVDVSALRRWARVTEVIRADEFDGVIALRTPKGFPLSWSHLEVLAKERSAIRRRALVARAAGEDLSVRGLSSLLARARQSPNRPRMH